MSQLTYKTLQEYLKNLKYALTVQFIRKLKEEFPFKVINVIVNKIPLALLLN